MLRVFLQPFPSYRFSVKQMFICVISGVIVFLIFFVAQPFNINRLSEPLQLKYSLVYGGVTAVGLLLLTTALPLLLPRLFIEENWVVWKEVLFVLLSIITIGALNLLAYRWLEPFPIDLISFFKFILATSIIGLLPISVSVLYKQKILLDRHNRASDSINSRLMQQKRVDLSEGNAAGSSVVVVPDECFKVSLTGDGLGESVEVFADDLWFLSSSDNYVRVVYRDNAIFKSVLLRSTLTKLEKQVEGISVMVRCQRGFLVNLSKLEKTVSSAQGLKLKLEQTDELIPVGKTYMGKIADMLELRF